MTYGSFKRHCEELKISDDAVVYLFSPETQDYEEIVLCDKENDGDLVLYQE